MATVRSDIEIARDARMKPIMEIGSRLGIPEKHLIPYGHTKAKVSLDFIDSLAKRPDGKLILVTAVSPTPAGEGKTTTTVGLADGLNAIGRKAMICLREPSLGPCFGMKGGAAGGGYAQVVPMEDINLHFTGDFHAITSAHNLLSAMIDNHVYWGNEISIDSRRVSWRRVMDMNDRALREIVCSLGGVANGYPREAGFDITVASEIMAILCLSTSIADLERRLGQIVIGAKRDRGQVLAKDLKAPGAMTVLLKDALMPNLVQTLENNPAFVHGGPFANIAHGCNSVMATKTALKLADFVVTEAGFGADLGAEKFFDIKCRKANLHPAAAVVVATVRALKMHGGVAKEDLKKENVEALKKGLRQSRPPHRQHEEVRRADRRRRQSLRGGHRSRGRGHQGLLPRAWRRGLQMHALGRRFEGHRGTRPSRIRDGRQGHEPVHADLRRRPAAVGEDPHHRPRDLPGRRHRRRQVGARPAALLRTLGYGKFPICMAKTQYSFSTDPNLKGAPINHVVPIREVRLSAGAEFIVVICGDIMTMPGLPKVPSAEMIGLDAKGQIVGLF